MNEREVHLKLSDVKIDNDNLDYIKMTGEICGKLRDDLVKLFAIPGVSSSLPDEYSVRNKAIELSKECDSRHSQIVCENAIVKFAKWFVSNDR